MTVFNTIAIVSGFILIIQAVYEFAIQLRISSIVNRCINDGEVQPAQTQEFKDLLKKHNQLTKNMLGMIGVVVISYLITATIHNSFFGVVFWMAILPSVLFWSGTRTYKCWVTEYDIPNFNSGLYIPRREYKGPSLSHCCSIKFLKEQKEKEEVENICREERMRRYLQAPSVYESALASLKKISGR